MNRNKILKNNTANCKMSHEIPKTDNYVSFLV